MELKELQATLKRIDEGIPALAKGVTDTRAAVTKIEEGQTSIATRMQSIEEWRKALDEKGLIPRGAGLPGADEKDPVTGKQRFSLSRACLMIAQKRWTEKQFGFEKEVIEQYHKRLSSDANSQVRDLATTVDSAAGFLVPPQVMTDLVEMLRANIVAAKLGATTLTGLIGAPVIIPKQVTAATIYGVAENAAITPSAQTVGQITMMPHEAAGLVKVSNLLLQLSNPSVDDMINSDLTEQMARYIDLKALRGRGAASATGPEPLGIRYTPGLSALAAQIDGVPTIDNLYKMLLAIEEANAVGDKMGWAFSPRTGDVFRRSKDAEGRYFFAADPSLPSKQSLIGFPFEKTTQIPNTLLTTTGEGTTGDRSELYLGNWKQLIIALWGGTMIKASQETSDAFAKNQTHIRIIQQFDIALRYAQAFCVDYTVKA